MVIVSVCGLRSDEALALTSFSLSAFSDGEWSRGGREREGKGSTKDEEEENGEKQEEEALSRDKERLAEEKDMGKRK